MNPKTVYHTSLTLNEEDIEKRNKIKTCGIIEIFRAGLDALIKENDNSDAVR